MKDLNRFSRRFAEALLGAFPWLSGHSRVDPDQEGCLLVEYSPLPLREACTMWISTENDEVTIGFGMFHSHFEWPVPDGDTSGRDPLQFLRELTQDTVLIEDWTRNGQWAGSSAGEWCLTPVGDARE